MEGQDKPSTNPKFVKVLPPTLLANTTKEANAVMKLYRLAVDVVEDLATTVKKGYKYGQGSQMSMLSTGSTNSKLRKCCCAILHIS